MKDKQEHLKEILRSAEYVVSKSDDASPRVMMTNKEMAEVYARVMESIPQTGTLEKKALSIDEACQYVGGISRPTLYGLLGTKALTSYTIGRRRYIMRSDLDAYIKERVEAGDAELS